MKGIAIAFATLFAVGPGSAADSPAPPTPPGKEGGLQSPAWRQLAGRWVGEGSGQPGAGTGWFEFAPALGGKILVRRNHAEYPATAERPAFTHDDLMVVYSGGSGEAERAIYFDNEGHVIRYEARWSPEGKVLTFLSEPDAGAPRYRLTYRMLSAEELALSFEIAPPDRPEAFKTYITAKARRTGPPVSP